MASNKHWTLKEELFLRDNWGKIRMSSIAKSLKRTLNAIKIKAHKMGLTDWRKDNEVEKDLVAFNYFVREILKAPTQYSQVNYVLTKYGFKFEYIKPLDLKYKSLRISSFVKWLDKNRHRLSIANSDDNAFFIDSPEPEWIKKKRKMDKKVQSYSNRKWTPEEDARLKSLLRQYKYGIREISIILKRVEPAIKRRMFDLKIKERPLKADNHYFWTTEEKELCKKLYLEGYPALIIAEHIKRSASAIQAYIERQNYYE